jgi:NADH:ubiquinone oxidoreductase subunit 3 (subunit A)
MSWSKDNTISVLALFASCTPIFIMLAAYLLRQRRLRAKKQRRYPRQWTVTALMLTEIARLDVERTSAVPEPQSWQYVWIRREYTLVALILIQMDAHFVDRGTWAMRSRYGESDSSSTSLTPWKDTYYR